MKKAKPSALGGDVIQTSIDYYMVRAARGLGGTTGCASKEGPSSGGAVGSKKAAPGGYKAPAMPAVKASLSSGEFGANQRDLADLCKRRFFYRQAFDIYGGVGGFYTYGPPGSAMKTNLLRQWRSHFVIEENLMEIEDTCIMAHQVLKASGHVDRFNDFMVKDVEDESKFFRADKLLEEVMEQKLAQDGITEEQRKEYTKVANQADGYSRQEMADIFKHYKIKSPETGNDLGEPYEFNLMFPTPIGPGGYLQGYLRPETAQGIFLNYKFCLEQNANKLPFGIAQIGRAFRNEIAPRAGLTRQREFTQGEIEYFVKPHAKDHPKFKNVAGLKLQLFPSPQQLAAEDPIVMELGEAVGKGVVNNETLGFFIGRTYLFLISVGIIPEYLRFRQHLPTEMAHYATDCWDAEIKTCYGWLECVGIADRACFDLNAHAGAAKCDLTYKETLENPIEVEVLAVTKAAGISTMKAFKKEGKMMKEWLENLPQDRLTDLHEGSKKGPQDVEVNGQTFTLLPEHLVCERKKEKKSVNVFMPGVVEPSFGIDRILFSIFEHGYYVRPAEEGSGDTATRGVLSLSATIAPYKCTLLPLDQRISRDAKYRQMSRDLRKELVSYGLSYTVDDSGATIGRRYARNDELGIPYAVTLDFETVGIAPPPGQERPAHAKDGTVTIRERDTMDQLRIPLDEVASTIRDLTSGELSWASILPKYPHRCTGSDVWTIP